MVDTPAEHGLHAATQLAAVTPRAPYCFFSLHPSSSFFSTMARAAPSTPRTPVTPRTTSNTVGGERNRRVSRKNVPSRRPSAAARANQRPPPLTPMRQKTKQRMLTPGGTPRPRRFRPGTRAIMEIRKFQRSTGLLIRRLPFARLVKEISQSYHHSMRYVIFLKKQKNPT